MSSQQSRTSRRRGGNIKEEEDEEEEDDDDTATPESPHPHQLSKSLDEVVRMNDEEYLDYIGNYKPGSIQRIQLKNFLTYESSW